MSKQFFIFTLQKIFNGNSLRLDNNETGGIMEKIKNMLIKKFDCKS